MEHENAYLTTEYNNAFFRHDIEHILYMLYINVRASHHIQQTGQKVSDSSYHIISI